MEILKLLLWIRVKKLDNLAMEINGLKSKINIKMIHFYRNKIIIKINKNINNFS
jgi:hypothetical protein